MDQPNDAVFISCAVEDGPWARRLDESLRGAGRTVAFPVRQPGQNYLEETLREGAARAENLVVIWSEHSKNTKSVHEEIAAFEASRSTANITQRRDLIVVDIGGGPLIPALAEAFVVAELVANDKRWTSPSEVPEEIWNAMVERLVRLLDGMTPAQKGSPPQANRPVTPRRNKRPTGSPAAGTPPATEPDDPLRADRVAQRYAMFQSVREILDHASEVAGKSIRTITSGLLLAAVSDRGTVMPSPTWAAAWLRSRWGDAGNTRLQELARETAAALEKEATPAVFVLTDGADQALDRASEIARRTSGVDEIRTRHLLGALLTDPRGADQSSTLGALEDLGHDVSALREAYFDFVRGYGDDDNAWGDILLGARPQEQLLSRFDADSDSGDDQLDIRPDVLAFAGLIASRTLKPPLSIGLFGEWGSGKTFFMRMLAKQVALLARHAREDSTAHRTRQREQTFYRRIVQIEFNAWHYAEGNLWASLVQHIFDNLRVIDDKKRRASEELQEPILKKLQVEKAAEAQARRELDDAERQRSDAATALDTAKTEFEKKSRDLAAISAANVLADAPSEKIQQAIAPALEALGFATVFKRGVELRATLLEAKGMLTRGHAALIPLMSSKDRQRRWIQLSMALLAGPAAAFVVLWITTTLGQERIANVAALSGGAASFLASCTAWLHRQLTWVGDRMKQVESAQHTFDESIEAAQADNLKKLREAQEQLRLLEADYVSAKQRAEDAHRRVVDAEAKLREATVPRLLTTFIEQRANSSDYRKHLGVLALVRNDFERLSDLISEENEQLDGVLRDGVDTFPTYDDELVDENVRINRIVLYIDDLDRCPPAKVVDVLQAVHLLLAFPLFVVVVGVDARWVVRSLEARYRELLKSDGGPPDQATVNEFRELFGNASAHDYVEKIFQVPFWLKPMSAESSRRLVRDLLKDSVAPRVPTTTPAVTPVNQAGPTPQTDTATPPVAAGTDIAAGPPPADSGSQHLETDQQAQAATTAESGRATPDLSPEGFTISPDEVQFISDLAPLLGRSPRTLKRFVNVYRLIRVGLSPWERQLFLLDDYGVADFRAVLFLLAVDTGAPLVAASVFQTIRDLSFGLIVESSKSRSQKVLAPTLRNLIDELDRNDATKQAPEWRRVRDWLDRRLHAGTLPDDANRFARWIPRVSRFSFHTGRL